jgi:MFS family permease
MSNGNGSQPADPRMLRRVVVGATVGTALEWYDFFIFGTAAALVFGDLFFSDAVPGAGTLIAFATFGVGFVARPFGGMIFGHLGDRIGRRETLIITTLVMGLSTGTRPRSGAGSSARSPRPACRSASCSARCRSCSSGCCPTTSSTRGAGACRSCSAS